MKEQISRKNFQFLQQQLSALEKKEIVSEQQVERALEEYEPSEKLNATSSILAIGAVVIALSVLTFVTSNWGRFTLTMQLSILIVGILVSLGLAFVLQRPYPKTARTIYYVAAAVIGASVYLIDSLFNQWNESVQLVLLWAIAVLPLIYFLRDRLLLIVLLILFSFVSWTTSGLFNLAVIIFAVVFIFSYWFNERYLNHSTFVFVVTTLAAVNWLIQLLVMVQTESLYIAMIIFAIGSVLLFSEIKNHEQTAKFLGSLMMAGTTFMLTTEWAWTPLFPERETMIVVLVYIVLAIFYFALMRTVNLESVILIGTLIMSLYFNYTFDVVSKPLFFLVAGILLIGIGLWFERVRRKEMKA